MGLKIHEYPVESLTFSDDDFYDIDFWNGATYETRKIKGSTIKAGIALASLNVYNTNGSLTGNRFVDLNSFILFVSDVLGTTKFDGGNKMIIEANAGQPALNQLDAGNGQDRIFEISTAGLTRWRIQTDLLEIGGDAGCDLVFNAYDDAGVLIGTLARFERNSGRMKINEAYWMPSLDGLAGQVLTTDGLGNVTWSTIAISNIYNSNGTLTGNRVVTLNGFSLKFNDAKGYYQIDNDGLDHEFFGGGANDLNLILNGGSGRKNIDIQRNGLSRWKIRTEGVESGGNSGTRLVFSRYDDTGAFIRHILELDRQNGLVRISDAYWMPGADGIAGQYLRTDGLGNLGWGTPSAEKRIGQDYAYNLSGAGGFTWNGITNVGTTTLTTLNERWRLQGFAGTGQPDGCFTNFLLPSTYIPGNNIKVTCTVTENGTGGNIKFWVGLAKPTAGNAFGSSADTEWLSHVYTAQNGFNVISFTLSFLGTNLTAGEPIGVLIFRDPADVQDTYSGDAYLNSVSVEQS